MIRIVDDIEEKQRIARSILTALPEWFGIPESTENYIRESANEIMVASFEEEKANGFLCLKETGKDTVELAVMGVLKTHHRKGIGRDICECDSPLSRSNDILPLESIIFNNNTSFNNIFLPRKRSKFILFVS